MVNISDLEKVRKATGIYSEYKEVFDCIRDIGVRAEAALKLL